MIQVHHLENSRSQRVLWLLEELNFDYEIVSYKRHPETMLAPPELEQIHPLGKSPVVVHDGVTVAESGAIIEFLLDLGDGKLRPEAGSQAHRDYRYWLHFAEGSLMPLLLTKLVVDRLGQKPVPFFLRPAGKLLGSGVNAKFIAPRIKQQLDFIESTLAERPWLAGKDLSGADIQMSFPLEAAATRMDFGRYKAISDYVARIHDREAYQRALERGGPYAYA